jgi:hypothetical protein
VAALLRLMRPHFSPEDFRILERTMTAFNAETGSGAGELLRRCAERPSSLASGFSAWADGLWDRGNLAEGLLTFIRDFG